MQASGLRPSVLRCGGWLRKFAAEGLSAPLALRWPLARETAAAALARNLRREQRSLRSVIGWGLQSRRGPRKLTPPPRVSNGTRGKKNRAAGRRGDLALL